MDGRSTLPWEALKQTGGDIPWPALYELAAAVVVDPFVVDELIDLYEQGVGWDYGLEHYQEFYVPAIFALAAPQLSGEGRREIGRFFLEKLADAGYEDEDLLMEVLAAACGSMGAEILPLVLETIANEPDDRGAWFHLWGLTELAAKTDDAQIREQVIQACTELLRKVDRGEIDLMCAMDAAWTLARMKHTDSAGLLRHLKEKSKKSFCEGDYSEALDLLLGCSDYTPPANLWERPVREWFEPRWRMARDWYAKNAGQNDEDEIDAGRRRAEELTKRFLKSSEAAQLPDELLDDAGLITHKVLEFAWVYAGHRPEEIDEPALEEVLTEVFPRKVTAERALFEKIAPVTEALLRWAESEGILADTEGLVTVVHSWADAIVANGMNPRYWGMAKSLYMQMRAAGVDTRDEEAVQRYIAEYNLRLMGQKSANRSDLGGFSPPIPIVEQSPKIGRNDPCPCGSGRKYKKCCGGVKKASIDF
jgi:uncharacterized protein YchJ